MILDFMASMRSELDQKANFIINNTVNKCFHVVKSRSVTSFVDLAHETPQASN